MDVTDKKPFINALLDNYLDMNVYRDILKSNAKETISLMSFGNLSITNMSTTLLQQVQFTETEILPFHQHDIDCADFTPTQEPRQPSVAVYNEKPLDFKTLQQLLINAFADHEGRRPYPSAGALYCVEPLVFLFEERLHEFKATMSGCYHFRPVTKQLQLIKAMNLAHFYDKLLHGFMKQGHLPCFGILYVVNISKAIFKYRYRGYRHALMEVGSMYQQATRCAEELGLRNTVWSTFSDQEMLYALELDHGAYMPITMQFFGYSES